MSYIIALTVLVSLYICAVYLMKYMKNVEVWNWIFSSSVFVLYISLSLKVYFDVGFYDWNFQNTLPVANVSPFMFSIVLIIQLLPEKIRKHFYLLISLLSVGMFLSAAFTCLYNAMRNYRFIPHFMLDCLAHYLLSLWGIYLVRTKQVEIKRKNLLISSSIIVGVAFLMLILNLIFDTSFFGLSLNGKHNIYNLVIVESSLLSAVLYFIGLLFVLLMGYVLSQIVNKSIHKNAKTLAEEKKEHSL